MKIKQLGFLAGCIAVLALVVSAVSAQEATPSPEPGRPELNAIETIIQATSNETGLTDDEIRQQLSAGKTLADIITENGGDVNAVIDESVTTLTDSINQAVKDGKITQSQADTALSNLKTTVTRIINGQAPQLATPPVVNIVRDAGTILIQAAADATGLKPDNIVAEMRDGKTLAAIVTENGGKPDDVITKAIAAATDKINQAVKAGKLTQTQADRLILGLKPLFTRLMNTNPRQGLIRRTIGLNVLRMAAQQTGLSPQDLMKELQSGKTLRQVLQEHNIDPNTFVDSVVANAKTQLDKQVANGRLTQAQEDQLLSDLRTGLMDRLDSNLTPEATPAAASA